MFSILWFIAGLVIGASVKPVADWINSTALPAVKSWFASTPKE